MARCGNSFPTPTHTHPFIHEGIILGCLLFPVRITLSTLFFLLMWPVARLRLAGLSAEERAIPVRGWRRWLYHPVMCFLSRSVFFSMGFLWIKVKGRQAGQKEAPVLAVAPHSGFLDMLVLPVSGLPMVVSRVENSKLPVIGALLEFNQAVLVSRKDPESRRKCVSRIKDRLTADGYWPQMLMFPEGTTTNGRALIKFKPGAFLAGVPVQPVLLHYPNRTDTVRWTWRGASWLDCLWYTSSQLYSNVTVEFLPVYTPSEEEKQNPELYADNVQKLMAKSLGVPATDYVMESLFPVTKLGGLSLPLESPAKETLALLRHIGVSVDELEEMMNRMMESCSSGLSSITTEQLMSLLKLSDHHTALKICSLYSKSDRMDARQLCLSVCTAAGLRPPQSLLHAAFSLYDSDGDGLLSADDLSGLMGALVGVPQYHITEMYTELIRTGEPTEGALYDLLTTHPTYQKLFGEYLHRDRARHATDDRNHNGIPDGKSGACRRSGVLNGRPGGGGGVSVSEKLD
ncbi:lysophospholipid acyltransferase LPCAT4 isoform X2 [Trichomycterus rosablanca]|uniref:lysophospholipid acyltransferase LPCAT4 isoform X2 n=1 Tax=Trichomycterus rosablanca TaxID=2290929 RepID=UPI002F35A62E